MSRDSYEGLGWFGAMRSHVANSQHLAGSRIVTIEDGPGRGLRILEIWVSGGLRVELLLDRASDIGRVEYCGQPISWTSPMGYRHSSASPTLDGLSFLTDFPGGLLATCGLEHAFSRESTSRGTGENPHLKTRHYPLHGSISHIPSSVVGQGVDRSDTESFIWVETQVEQVVLFEENLTLHRRIEVSIDRPRLTLRDEIRNDGIRPCPIMLDYHINYGYPLVSPGARIRYGRNVDFWEDDPTDLCVPSPATPSKESVNWHLEESRNNGDAGRASIINRELGLAVTQSWRGDSLKYGVLWEWYESRAYVVGLEVATASPEGRRTPLGLDQLIRLDPSDSLVNEVQWDVVVSRAHMAAEGE